VNAFTLQTLGLQTVTAQDAVNTAINATAQITVTNDAPLTPQGMTIRLFRSTPPVVVATFTDADPAETGSNLSATIDWGDGTGVQPAAAVVPAGNQVFQVLGSHAYASKGVFTVKVTMTDLGGSISIANSTASFLPRNLSF